MNPEQIINPIEASDHESHEEMLTARLIGIQIAFADKKFMELSKESEALRFADILEKYTAVGGELEYAFRKYHQPFSEDECNKYSAGIMKKVDEIYQLSGADSVARYIVSEIDVIKLSASEDAIGKEKEKRERRAKNENRAGIFNYDLADDGRINVHVEELYKQKDGIAGSDSIRESFQKLAVAIIEKYPQISKIVGRSWLMAHPLAERLGFKIVGKDTIGESLQHSSSWWQFMDKDGQINSKRFEDLMKSGKLPLPVALGEMEVEYFLKRYLPAEKRGKIMLKKITSENQKKIETFKELGKKIKKDWKELSESEIDNLILGNELLGGFIKTSQIGKEYHEIILATKRSGASLEEAEDSLKEKAKVFKEELEKYFSQKLWEDVEVNIE